MIDWKLFLKVQPCGGRMKPNRPRILDMDAPDCINPIWKGKGQYHNMSDAELEEIMNFAIDQRTDQFLPMLTDMIMLAKMSITDNRLSFPEFNQQKNQASQNYDHQIKCYEQYLESRHINLKTMKLSCYEILDELRKMNDTDGFTTHQWSALKSFYQKSGDTRSRKPNPTSFHKLRNKIDWDKVNIMIDNWTYNDLISFSGQMQGRVASLGDCAFDHEGNKI